ncbi:MAG: glycine--tRNA ligase [Christensenellaceae bacterium]|jgi:glycyl-tRNA synthetase|nr:glycine--tRNA ligase [Christensenellaceae bacterium]
MKKTENINTIINLCKTRGFIFAGSDIYDGLANTWDYGPLGVELKNKIKQLWWKEFVLENHNSVGIDGGILMNRNVWVASGHVSGFSDPLMDCRGCKSRLRADKLIEEKFPDVSADGWDNQRLLDYVNQHDIKCPVCGKRDWTDIRQFNLMFETYRGVTKDNSAQIFLRPETAQSEYINFINVQRAMRLKIPFGIGQIGKAFRNEITPGNFIFRTIEFEQMEHQLFCKDEDALREYQNYKQKTLAFYTQTLGISPENLRFRDHEKLVFYAKAACDAEYLFPFGWGEINGTHHRGIHDLSSHQKLSGKSMEYFDPITNQKFIPTVIESSHGVDRIFLALLCDAYHIDGDRTVLKLKPSLAPYTVCVLPLQKKDLSETAEKIFRNLQKHFSVSYDESGSIGKRYFRQDEIGTPFCVTIDYDTLKDGTVTVRERDTTEQTRIKIADLPKYITDKQ